MMTHESIPLRGSAVLFCAVGLCLMAWLLGAPDAQGLVVKVGTADRGILGTWEATDRAWHIEFAPDGVIRMRTHGPAKTGTYRLDAHGILWVRMDNGQDYRAPLKLAHQDQLLIMKPDGSIITFRRVE
jgi:hypothetical protein